VTGLVTVDRFLSAQQARLGSVAMMSTVRSRSNLREYRYASLAAELLRGVAQDDSVQGVDLPGRAEGVQVIEQALKERRRLLYARRLILVILAATTVAVFAARVILS
jgi:hypothetical protein